MCFSCVFEIFMVIASACWILHVHVAYLCFKQYIKYACGSKEHKLPNNMYYVTQSWKYSSILEI
jgi:hypothetical protein